MTRNRTYGLRRGQDVQSRSSDRGSKSATSSSNFDEENFWTPLEKNYFSPPSIQLIKLIRNVSQMYKIIQVTGLKSRDTWPKPYTIELKINKCKRYRDGIEWAIKCAREKHGEGVQPSRRNHFGFNPELSPKYYGRGSLPLVMRPSPDYLSLSLMDSPFSLQAEVLCGPICNNCDKTYVCNDEAWALHPRFSVIVEKSNFSCYPPYKYQKFSERTPFCNKCYGIQRSCGESSTMDFNIKPKFPDYCFIPNKLPIDQLRQAMSNVDFQPANIINNRIFKPLDPKENHCSDCKVILKEDSRIEDDYCAAYEFYADLLDRIGEKFDNILKAYESEKRPDYEAWKKIELNMMSQYMNEYKTNVDTIYTYTSSLQLLDLERLRINCKDSSNLPSNWTEKALCSVCSTADDWDDNPIMFCDSCYLPMHVKCVASDIGENDEDSWVCQLCSFLTSQISHIEYKRAYDIIRKLSTSCIETRGGFSANSLRLTKIDSEAPCIPISDIVYEKFIKPDNNNMVDVTCNGLLYVKDPTIYVKMLTNYHTDASLYVPFCMLCGFSTLCTAGGPAMPTNRLYLWAHVKCALTIGIIPKKSGEEISDHIIRRTNKTFYTGRCSVCRRWGSCLAQCSSSECTRFFHIPCITASRDSLYEWDTSTNKADILCHVHAKGVSPNSLLRRVQQRLEGDYYKNKTSQNDFYKRNNRLGIYARDFLETDKSSLLNLFKDAYCSFKSSISNANSLVNCHVSGNSQFSGNSLEKTSLEKNSLVSGDNVSDRFDNAMLISFDQTPCQRDLMLEKSSIDELKSEENQTDEQVEVAIPLGALPTPPMLLDIFTDLPSFQTVKYSNGLSIGKDVSFFRSVCEAAVVLSELFDLASDVKFIVNIFNYISKVSFLKGIDPTLTDTTKMINAKNIDQFCSGCGLVESKRITVKRCSSCLASICKNCFSYGVGAARSTANCTNSQFESGIVTCARCYRYVCGKPFGACYLCGRLDGFLFAGVDCLVHLICAQLLIPPKSWGDGIRLGRVNNTRTSSCYYCRLNIGLTSTCASPTCGVRFHPYCAFVLKGHSKSVSINSDNTNSVQCVTGLKKDRSKSENLLKAKKPGVAFTRILCVVHSNKDIGNNISDISTEERRSTVLDFFRGIDYTFTHRQSTRKLGQSNMDTGKKRGAKTPDLRKFLTMQEIMQYGHSGRTSDDNYYCPICFSLYYETSSGLPGDDLHWIGCDGCERWFHWICIGYSDNDPPKESEWFCATCKNPKEDNAQ